MVIFVSALAHVFWNFAFVAAASSSLFFCSRKLSARPKSDQPLSGNRARSSSHADIAHLFLYLFGAAQIHERGSARIRFAEAFLHFSLRRQIDIRTDFIGEVLFDSAPAREVAEES
jgi:hypothetical protein